MLLYVCDSEAYCALTCVHGPVQRVDWFRCYNASLFGAVLVAALRSHGEASAVVAEKGLWAVAKLCYYNAANTTRLGEAGACEGVCVCACVCMFLCAHHLVCFVVVQFHGCVL